MKDVILISLTALMTVAFTVCNTNNEKEDRKFLKEDHNTLHRRKMKDGYKANTVASAKFDECVWGKNRRNKNEAIFQPEAIPVGKPNFTKLVTFIEKHGFVAPEHGIPCDHQYTFIDSKGNRHAMITIKRDKARNPSMTGVVNQISVWAYYNSIKDQNHFFGYVITEERVNPFCFWIDGTWREVSAVKRGYNQFLVKISK